MARWEQRGLSVVFPIGWAHEHGEREMIRHARSRIAEVEGQAGRHLISGSVLRAFALDRYAPEVPRGIMVRAHTRIGGG